MLAKPGHRRIRDIELRKADIPAHARRQVRAVQGPMAGCAPALATLLYDETRRTSALGRYASLTALASVVAGSVMFCVL